MSTVSKRNYVNIGDVLRSVSYIQVKNVYSYRDRIDVVDLHTGTEYIIEGRELIDVLENGSQYDRTVERSRTDIVTTLVNSHGLPCTIVWTKKDGSKRTLVGRVVNVDDKHLGYLGVEDLLLDKDEHRYRLVDCRTIERIIIDGVQYLVK